MLRLLALTESLDPGSGWGTYSQALIQTLGRLGVEVTILQASQASCQLPAVHAGLREWLKTFTALRNKRSGWDVDVIHSFVEPYAKLSRALPQPQVITVHGTFADPAAHGPRWSQYGFRDALQQSAAIVAVSAYTRRHLPMSVQDRTVVIPNGIDLDIQIEPYELPSDAGGHPLIFSAGALKPRKGFDHLLKGFAVFKQRHPKATLVIAGDDRDVATKQELEQLIDSHNLRSCVRLLGHITRPQLLGWYRACDVFALTPVSDRGGFEGFGLVYLEANAFGKPCVGTRDSGAQEAIAPGVTGFLAERPEPELIANALEEALHLPAEPILSHIRLQTWDARARAYLAVYQSVLK